MKTNDLISQLVGGLKPVAPIRPSAWFGGWVAVGAFFVVGTAGFFGVRPDLVVAHPWFFIESTLILLTSGACAWRAVKLGIPGSKPTWMDRLPVFLIALWAGGTVVRLFRASSLVPDLHVVCAAVLWGVGIVVSIPLFIFLRRAAPLNTAAAGASAGLAGASMSALSVQLFCVNSSPVHDLLWHILPFLLSAPLGLLGAAIWVKSPFAKSRPV